MTGAWVAARSQQKSLMRFITITSGLLGTECSCLGSITLSGLGGGSEPCVMAN